MTLSYIRTTPTGVKEYWDSDKKKLVSYKKGEEPSANQLNQGEMIGQFTSSGKERVEGVDFTTGKDMTTTNLIKPNFEDMTVKELKQYAKDNAIDIPSELTKKDDIIAFLSESK